MKRKLALTAMVLTCLALLSSCGQSSQVTDELLTTLNDAERIIQSLDQPTEKDLEFPE